jgi:hypothetical protein
LGKNFQKEAVKEPILQNSILKVVKVEDDAVIVLVEGWRMRVYFDKGVNKEDFHEGKLIGVKHQGDINKPHSVKFEKIK